MEINSKLLGRYLIILFLKDNVIRINLKLFLGELSLKMVSITLGGGKEIEMHTDTENLCFQMYVSVKVYGKIMILEKMEMLPIIKMKNLLRNLIKKNIFYKGELLATTIKYSNKSSIIVYLMYNISKKNRCIYL